ncbi:MAG: peptidoglycan-binding domain-containing protein [Pseudomonadota bacterium]
MAINFDKVPSYIRREIDPPKKVLKRGSNGRHAKQVQEWLQFHQCRTGIDGKYGPATQVCVKDFQALTGLRETGKIDKATWQALVAPMTTALAAPKIAATDAAPSTVRDVAMQHVQQRPHEIGGSNRGPWVRLYCDGNDGSQWAWCAGFVSFIMQQAYFYRHEKPPIKGSVSCDSLAAQGKEKGLFVPELSVSKNKVPWDRFGGACLFLRRRTSTDWTHTGIATTASGRGNNLVFHTIEGNTNDEGHREGYEACERKRSIDGSHYDFVSFVPTGP